MGNADSGNSGGGSIPQGGAVPATGATPATVEWTSPDGIKVQIPAEHRKAFEGINTRFSQVTKKEQEISRREAEIDLEIQRRLEEERDATAQEHTAKPRGKAKPAVETPEDDRIGTLAQELAELKAQRKQEAFDRDVAEFKNDLAAATESVPEFAQLKSQRSQRLAFNTAWDIMQQSKFTANIEEAVRRGVTEAIEYEKDVIDGHAASKKAGPGLPGSGGEAQKPISQLTEEEADALMLQTLRSGTS